MQRGLEPVLWTTEPLTEQHDRIYIFERLLWWQGGKRSGMGLKQQGTNKEMITVQVVDGKIPEYFSSSGNGKEIKQCLRTWSLQDFLWLRGGLVVPVPKQRIGRNNKILFGGAGAGWGEPKITIRL